MNKEYLGDGVYIEVERNMLKLTTSDGIQNTNTIYFEDFVLDALESYIKRLRGESQ